MDYYKDDVECSAAPAPPAGQAGRGSRVERRPDRPGSTTQGRNRFQYDVAPPRRAIHAAAARRCSRSPGSRARAAATVAENCIGGAAARNPVTYLGDWGEDDKIAVLEQGGRCNSRGREGL